MLKIIGAGYPRTGTSSLCEALRILGFNAIHHEPQRLELSCLNRSSFLDAYCDVEAVTDAPACFFWREIMAAYPDAKVILTIRRESDWWESIKWHVRNVYGLPDEQHVRDAMQLHGLLFGTPFLNEYLWRRAYHRHNHSVANQMQMTGRFMLFPLCAPGRDEEKWLRLCNFMGIPDLPDEPFPTVYQRPKE